ncbi:class I SAM-dependent methyltransferase [Pseudanabaenaceae cyanobacterium LEGE 13415]|nr:class I SAM-dependent methyltransferase [Pseudanabaenaceae cyanobacterium LEGE 13415]
MKNLARRLLNLGLQHPKVRAYVKEVVRPEMIDQARSNWEIEHQAQLNPNSFLNSPQFRFAPPGHFYSPLPDLDYIEATVVNDSGVIPSLDSDKEKTLSDLDLDLDRQFAFLTTLLKFYPDAAALFPESSPGQTRYWFNNSFYSYGDGIVLFGMTRYFTPRRVIEVGSGFSSALLLDTVERYSESATELIFIEPYPDRLQELLRAQDTVTLIDQPVQSVSASLFEQLQANDILLIDSSHVTKTGSDVNYLVFEVLPRLSSGVIVHFHDIFSFEYPIQWLREGRAWNEAYLIRAFLQYNSMYEILLMNNYVSKKYDAKFAAQYPLLTHNPGCALWLRKR